MKRAFIIGILFLAVCVGAVTIRTKVTFTCNYPIADDDFKSTLWFNVYSTTNVSLPASNWPKIFKINATNTTEISSNSIRFDVPFDGAVIQRFYMVTSSNSWFPDESGFSNVARTPPPPLDVINLRLDLTDAP